MKRRQPAGFTLLEVLVALVIVGLILLLAVQLLGEVHAVSVQWRRTLPDPVPEFAIQLLRSDIHRSKDIATPPGIGPLGLRQSDGSTIYYDESLGKLVRTVVAADGSVQGERVVMHGVTFWSWHNTLAPGLVETQVVYRSHRNPGSRRLRGVGGLQQPSDQLQNLTLRFAQRARPGRRVF